MINIEITGKGLNIFIPTDDIKYFNRHFKIKKRGDSSYSPKNDPVFYYWDFLFNCVSVKISTNKKYNDKAYQLKLLGD